MALAGIVALAAALAWRLAQGPIVLPALTPRLEQVFGRADGSLAVRIARTELAWDGAGREVDLLVRDVHVVAGGAPLLRLPVASLKFAAWPLFRGQLLLRAIELPDPHWRLRRDASGVQLDLGDGGGATTSVAALLSPWLAGTAGPLAELRHIEISNGQVTVVASDAHASARLAGVTLRFAREAGRLQLAGTARLGMGEHVVPITVDGRDEAATGTATLTVGFERADPAVLATLFDRPSLLAATTALDTRVSGSVQVTFDARLVPQRAEYTLRAERGGLRLDGDVALAAPSVGFTATATGDDVTMADLARLWPAEAAVEAREWVTSHVRDGRVPEARVDVRGHTGDDGQIALDLVEGRFAFAGVTVRPLDTAAPLTGLAGKGHFDRGRLHFDVARGQIDGLDVARGTVEVAGIGAAAPTTRVHATVRGPLARAMALLETQGGPTGLAGTAVTGRVDATLTLAAPLGAPVQIERHVTSSGRLSDVGLPRLLGEWSLSDGAFAFDLERGRFSLRGTSRVATVPVDVVLTQRLGTAAREIVVTSRPGAAGRAALGFDLRPWVDGVTAVRVSTPVAGAADAVALSIDLREAVLAEPRLGIEKRAGVDGTAEARLRFDGARLARVENATLRFGATRARATARLAADGTVERLEMDATLGPGGRRRVPVVVRLDVAPGSLLRTVVATADEASLLFDALGMSARATGGRVRVDGTLATGAGVPFDGRLEARDFRLTEAPLLARLLALTSVRGLGNVFGDQGIAVTRLAAQLRYRAPTLTITDGTLESSSLGLRVAGTMETGGGQIDLRGSLAPSFYGLNRLGGRVPVLGRVITGAGNEGIQVFRFAASGPTASPRITVDPASSLAPGAVRDLLNLLPRPTRR